MSKIENFRKQIESGFKKDRVSLKSIVALVLFGAIILVFVFFGLHNQGVGGGSAGSAGRVNNKLISVAELRSETQRLEQMYAPMFGGQSIGAAQRQFLQQQALESLIAQELASQLAKKEGILATDKEIQDTIVKEIPAFQRDGRFQRDLYYQLLQANYMNPADFEARIRKEKQNFRTRRMFEVTAQPLQLEVAKLKALQEMQMNVSFARLDKELVLKAMKTSSADVQAKLATPDFAKRVEEYYNANKAEFKTEPQARVQHILIKTTPEMTDEKAKTKILEIKNRATKEDFGKLAAQLSEDTGSKAKNGDLGYFGKGRMVPEFETAAFTQKVGEVGEPVKTNFGYHLVKVLDRKEEHQGTLEEVRMDIAQKLIATELYDSEIKTIEDALAKNDSAAVDAQLKKMGVNWDETGFFDLGAEVAPKLGSPEATAAAFQVSAAKPLYPKVVRDGAEKFVVKFKAEKKAAAPAGDTASAVLSQQRAAELFGSWIENAKQSAKIERNMQLLQQNL